MIVTEANLLTGEVFDKAYNEYKDECDGIALMTPSNNFGGRGIEGAYKDAARRMVAKVLDEYAKGSVYG